MQKLQKWLSIVVLALIVAGLLVPNPVLDPTPVAEAGRTGGAILTEPIEVPKAPFPASKKLVSFGNQKNGDDSARHFEIKVTDDGPDVLIPLASPDNSDNGPKRAARITGTCGTVDFRVGSIPKEEVGQGWTTDGVVAVIVAEDAAVDGVQATIGSGSYQIWWDRTEKQADGSMLHETNRTGQITQYPPFPNYSVVFPTLYIMTGTGIVEVSLNGFSIVYKGDDRSQAYQCMWRRNVEVVEVGYRRNDDGTDGPGSTFEDFFPPTGDPAMGTSKFPDPDNKHCESCDKDEDARQEDAMFATRDKICEPIRYQEFGYAMFRACKKSGLLAIRASESNTANIWTRWTAANRNGWRTPWFGTEPTIDGSRYTVLNNLNAAWECVTNCAIYKPYIPQTKTRFGPLSQTVPGHRPPADNTQWKPNPGRTWPQGPAWPEVCDAAPHPLYGCQVYQSSTRRPPAEDGTGGGPKAAPEWTPIKKKHSGLRFEAISDFQDDDYLTDLAWFGR